MKKYFREIDFSKYENYNIILDIDGTLCPGGESLVENREKKVVKSLREKNKVYIFSNNTNKKRSKDIARQVDCKYLKAPHKKPCKKIIKYLPDVKKLPILIIGDKFLIDVVFARRIKSEYILVKSLQSKNDRWLIKLFNIIDNFFQLIINN